MLVLDSMAVIHLAKAGVLETVVESFGGGFIPTAVEREAVEMGRKMRKPDAEVIAFFIKTKTLAVKEPERGEYHDTLRGLGLGEGELEAILLCMRNKDWLLVSNDRAARRIAPIFNIKLATVPQIIVAAAVRGGLGKQWAAEAIIALKRIGWYSNEIIDLALQALEGKQP